MPDALYLLAAVAISAAVTWGLRALPFAALTRLRASRTVDYLSDRMPTGVMVILLIYCLRDVPLTAAAGLKPPALALAVTICLHLWRHNAVLSILGGTVVNVTLASTFAGCPMQPFLGYGVASLVNVGRVADRKPPQAAQARVPPGRARARRAASCRFFLRRLQAPF